ncbi:hypothetical protein LDENG_00167370 [Lucifuga dentata]|nr:hypothetical protein LDENG_00167370 [Lucifuga dentata]
MAMVELIIHSDKSEYRHEVAWCKVNNLSINVKKTKELVVEFRKHTHTHTHTHIGGAAVEGVSCFRYLGVNITGNLTWSSNTATIVKKAHQRLYFLRKLKHAGLSTPVLTSFYRCVVESILTSCITVWYGNCSAADRRALEWVVKSAQKTISSTYPPSATFTSTGAGRTPALSRTPATLLMDCLPPSLQAGGYTASEPEPPG